MTTSEPVVVFRSTERAECGAVAGALVDQGLQAWVHDDFSSALDTTWLDLRGRPACVSVPREERDRALALVASMVPNARAQRREPLDPIHGRGQTISAGWRVFALLALIGFAAFGIVRLVQLFESLRR